MKVEALLENIQRLADGDLTEKERSKTLLWIEQSAPCYWRDLSLAYTEAQIFTEAAGEQKLTELPPLRQHSWLSSAAKLAIAASLATGLFAAGFLANSRYTPELADHNAPANLALPPANSVSLAGLSSNNALPVPATDPVDKARKPDVKRSIAAVKRLNAAIADSGYEASLLTRYVSQQLDSGERIVIPVNKVIVRHRAE
ncbi:MAG: hypothetical protein ACI9R3_006276 [Verrucomicrobiales bacterium]|jgi:hypothetical protein